VRKSVIDRHLNAHKSVKNNTFIEPILVVMFARTISA